MNNFWWWNKKEKVSENKTSTDVTYNLYLFLSGKINLRLICILQLKALSNDEVFKYFIPWFHGRQFFQNKFWIEFDSESGSILKRPNWELSRNSHVIKTHKYSKDRVIKWVGLERRNVARLPSLPCYSGWKIKQGRWELHIEYAVPCKNIRIHDDTQKTELQEKFCGGLSNQRRIDDRQCVQQLWHNILNHFSSNHFLNMENWF